jgi:hypothetical protein
LQHRGRGPGAGRFWPWGRSRRRASTTNPTCAGGSGPLAEVGTCDEHERSERRRLGTRVGGTSRGGRTIEGRGGVEALWRATKAGGRARVRWSGRMAASRTRWREPWCVEGGGGMGVGAAGKPEERKSERNILYFLATRCESVGPFGRAAGVAAHQRQRPMDSCRIRRPDPAIEKPFF